MMDFVTELKKGIAKNIENPDKHSEIIKKLDQFLTIQEQKKKIHVQCYINQQPSSSKQNAT